MLFYCMKYTVMLLESFFFFLTKQMGQNLTKPMRACSSIRRESVVRTP